MFYAPDELIDAVGESSPSQVLFEQVNRVFVQYDEGTCPQDLIFETDGQCHFGFHFFSCFFLACICTIIHDPIPHKYCMVLATKNKPVGTRTNPQRTWSTCATCALWNTEKPNFTNQKQSETMKPHETTHVSPKRLCHFPGISTAHRTWPLGMDLSISTRRPGFVKFVCWNCWRCWPRLGPEQHVRA